MSDSKQRGDNIRLRRLTYSDFTKLLTSNKYLYAIEVMSLKVGGVCVSDRMC